MVRFPMLPLLPTTPTAPNYLAGWSVREYAYQASHARNYPPLEVLEVVERNGERQRMALSSESGSDRANIAVENGSYRPRIAGKH